MTNRVRWHTPPTRPAHKAKDQENVPAGVLALYPQFSEKLDALERLLQKHGNPTSTPLGQANDFQLWAEYEREYPGQLTPKMQTPRYSYFLMAQLATADDVKAWLEEWRHAGLDLGPFAKTSFFANPNLAQQLPPHACGFHAHLDETLPNGTVRHLHDTQVAANSDPTGAARIVLGDPYLGSGLDPTRLSGVVAPYRSTLEPYMACCGQPIGSKQDKNAIPPGCWIQMDPRRPAGQLVPYTLWFSSNGEADILDTWQSAIENRLVDRIRNRVQTGTAFIQEEYYANLDRQIRALLVAPGLATAIQAVHANVFNANFAGDGPWAQLSETHREELRMLVALVDRYNAPQLGACHRELKRSDSELEALIFRPLEGRMLWLEKKLVKVVKINGRDIAILSVDNFETSVIKLITNLQAVGLGTAAKTLQDTARLVVNATEQQQFVEEQKRATDQELPTLRSAALRIGIPNLLAPKFLYQTGLYEEAEKLKTELIGLLNTLAKETNDWLRTEAKTPLVLSNQDRFRNIAPDMQVYGEALSTVAAQFKQFTVILNGFNPTQDELSAVLYNDQKPYLALPEVVRWARLRLLIERFPGTQKAMVISNSDSVSILQAARQAIAYAKEEASARAAAAAAAAAATETAERAAREEAQRRATEAVSSGGGRRIVTLESGITIANPFIPESGPLIQTGYKYDNSSCSFDTLFAALFMIPNQWFRRVIEKAKQVRSLPTCSAADVAEVHRHLIQVIEYMEKRRAKATICPTMDWWQRCMNTRDIGRENERLDDPNLMLRALSEFYGVEQGLVMFGAKSEVGWGWTLAGDPITNFTKFVSVTNAPRNQIFDEIPETIQGGLFTITACIVFSTKKAHWQICLRDPRMQTWHRLDDDGVVHRLSENPQDIRGDSKDPGEKKPDENYIYQPAYWFFQRTSMLAPLLPNFVVNNETFKGQGPDTQRVQIFGRQLAYANQGLPIDSLNRDRIVKTRERTLLGSQELLFLLDETNDDMVNNKNLNYAFEFPWTVENVNNVLIYPIRQMVETLLIDDQSIAYVIGNFKPIAISVRLLEQGGDDWLTVPYWSETEKTGSISPESNWVRAGRSREWFEKRGKLWALALLYLLWLLTPDTNQNKRGALATTKKDIDDMLKQVSDQGQSYRQ